MDKTTNTTNTSYAYRKFEELCKKNKVTPYQISKETGIPSSALCHWKQGKYNFKLDKLLKIAEFFGVSIEELVG